MKNRLFPLGLLVLNTSLLLHAADAKAGKPLYEASCKSCHGVTGTANPAIAKMMKVEMKDLGSKEVQALTDAQLHDDIIKGTGKMRPVKAVNDAQATDIVAYIRTFAK